MPIFSKVLKAKIAANAVDQAIGEIAPIEGEEITILEIGYKISAAGKVDGYVGEVLTHEADYDAYPDVNHRMVTNNVLVAGQKATFKGTDTSGATNLMAVYLVYDKRAI